MIPPFDKGGPRGIWFQTAPIKGGVAVLLTVLLILLSAATAQAAPAFTQAESRALPEYARGCLTAQVTGTAPPPAPEVALKQHRPCFVTFFQGSRVFACFGGFTPRRKNLADEIGENVRLALINDLRARNVSQAMASAAGVQITFPEQPEQVGSYREIAPDRQGMFVEGANGGVAFVPGEARTASWAFREALRRLGEHDPTAVAVYRFKATAVSTRQDRN